MATWKQCDQYHEMLWSHWQYQLPKTNRCELLLLTCCATEQTIPRSFPLQNLSPIVLLNAHQTASDSHPCASIWFSLNWVALHFHVTTKYCLRLLWLILWFQLQRLYVYTWNIWAQHICGWFVFLSYKATLKKISSLNDSDTSVAIATWALMQTNTAQHLAWNTCKSASIEQYQVARATCSGSGTAIMLVKVSCQIQNILYPAPKNRSLISYTESYRDLQQVTEMYKKVT